MWVKKSEITGLSDNIKRAINGEEVDFRDNKEGALSILKNDIHTLVNVKKEQLGALTTEHTLSVEFMENISHQLKTPITSMMIMADLLENAEEGKREEFIFNIRKSLSRMDWLTSNLLKMAKLDSGMVVFRKERVSAAKLLESALEPLAIMLDIKKQAVELKNQADFICDIRWTAEALTNLIKNASENSCDNTTINLDSGENPIYRWISVTDAGNGISRDRISLLFKRFEGSESESGFGIGLPLALTIVRGQNGDIDVDGGGNGVGATFTIKFFK